MTQKKFAIVCVLIVGVVLFVSAAGKEEPAVVSAREFRLLDQNGKIRAKIATTDGGLASIGIADENESPRIMLVVDPNGNSTISLSDEHSKIRVHMIVENGTPMFSLNDTDAKPRAVLSVDSDGTTGFALLDENKKVRVGLETANDDVARISVLNKDNAAGSGFVIAPDGTAMLLLRDAVGKPTWVAPPDLK